VRAQELLTMVGDVASCASQMTLEDDYPAARILCLAFVPSPNSARSAFCEVAG